MFFVQFFALSVPFIFSCVAFAFSHSISFCATAEELNVFGFKRNRDPVSPTKTFHLRAFLRPKAFSFFLFFFYILCVIVWTWNNIFHPASPTRRSQREYRTRKKAHLPTQAVNFFSLFAWVQAKGRRRRCSHFGRINLSEVLKRGESFASQRQPNIILSKLCNITFNSRQQFHTIPTETSLSQTFN